MRLKASFVVFLSLKSRIFKRGSRQESRRSRHL